MAAKKMRIRKLEFDFSVCKVEDYSEVDLNGDYCFIGKTEEENSLVCRTELIPGNTLTREDGWKAFRIEGVLDFSLTGILAGISGLLAEHEISIFAVSTYNTDYIFIKKENFEKAVSLLSKKGCQLV